MRAIETGRERRVICSTLAPRQKTGSATPCCGGTMLSAAARQATRPAVATDLRCYDALWSTSYVASPQRFNTWPLLSTLAAAAPARLEIGPGLHPRRPIGGPPRGDRHPFGAPASHALERRRRPRGARRAPRRVMARRRVQQTPDGVVPVPGSPGFSRHGRFYCSAQRPLAVFRAVGEKLLRCSGQVVPSTIPPTEASTTRQRHLVDYPGTLGTHTRAGLETP